MVRVVRVQYAVMATILLLCTIYWFTQNEPVAVAIGVAGIIGLAILQFIAERRLAAMQRDFDTVLKSISKTE